MAAVIAGYGHVHCPVQAEAPGTLRLQLPVLVPLLSIGYIFSLYASLFAQLLTATAITALADHITQAMKRGV
jgi:hypothetical protein